MTTVIPTNADELAEMLADPVKAGKLVNDGKLGEVITAHARAVTNKDKEVLQQVVEQQQLVIADMLGQDKVTNEIKRLNQAVVKNQGGQFGSRKGSIYNKSAPGAAIDGIMDGPAEFFQSIWHNRETLAHSDDLSAKASQIKKIQASYGSVVPGDGGFLIPEVLRSEILSMALENSIVRPRARVIPMDSLRVPFPMVDETSHASSVFGGVVCYWTEEAASATESQASFGELVLQARKLTGYAEVPNELLSDAPAFGSYFDQVFPQALAYFEDDAFVAGNGVGQPLGFLNGPATVVVAKESGQPATTIVWENIVKMYARMLPTSHSNAVWIVSPDTFPELATMALSVGTGGSAIWLQNGVDGPPMTILGRPVIVSEKAKTLGAQGDVNYVDLSYYLIGDRQSMSATSSPHFKFSSDRTAFKIIERVDGQPWLKSAITPRNSGNPLSPFVQLGAR
jgi:HK97 family phage major capsid protein